MAVYTGTMEGRLKDALVAWADAQLIHEASKDTSGCKFIFDFDSVLAYLEDNEGLLREHLQRAGVPLAAEVGAVHVGLDRVPRPRWERIHHRQCSEHRVRLGDPEYLSAI